MDQPAFGILLRRLREERGLSLREFAQLAEVDHAYVYRLETGAKEAPSDEIVTKFIRASKGGKREADMLRYLARHPDTDAGLVEHVLSDPSVSFDVFAAAAGMVFRGMGRPDYAQRIARIRRLVEEESNG